jgi:hypothetical protein
MIKDGHEAYIEIQGDWGRLAGGTKDEIESFWEGTKHQTGGCKSRLIINGQVMEERSIGSDGLRQQVTRRLTNCKWGDEDAELIAKLAELLGVDIPDMDGIF